jgi:hypothetical protein
MADGQHRSADAGDWKETRITPDLWEISYAVTKRRAGQAPDNPAAPRGAEYHWFILAHLTDVKGNPTGYDTRLTGLKFKLAQKKGRTGRWSASGPAQRKQLIAFLKEFVEQLEKKPVPIEFEYRGKKFKGEGIPVPHTCTKGCCYELDITLNRETLGFIRYGPDGWQMDLLQDQQLIDAIGGAIMKWFEG